MPDRDDTLVLDQLDERDEWEPEDELPPRPRRRAITPVGLVLGALLLVAGGFYAGVEVQKNQKPSSQVTAGARSAAGAPGGFRGGGGTGGPFDGGGGGGAAPTIGQVANKDGKTLYVKDSSGATIRVKTTSASKVTRTAGSSVKGIYPGDTVIVQGSKHSDGSITASQIRATAKGASGGGAALFGAAPPGGAPPDAGG